MLMRLKFNKLFYLLLLLCFLSSCSNKENKVSPNIVYILADDLGYGEVGYNGQEIIKTPNITTKTFPISIAKGIN